MVIYLDVLLALNLFIDFLLLASTARLLHVPHRRGRLVLGALAGSVSACLCLVDWPTVLLWSARLAAAAVVVRLAFRWQGRRSYMRQLAVFFLVSALFGGVSFALWFFVAPTGMTMIHGVVYYDVSPLMLTIFTLISYAVLCVYDRITRKRVAGGHTYYLEIQMADHTVCLRSLYDTGHHVVEPFSGRPVVIVRRGAVESCLPARFGETEQEELSAEAAVATRVRRIPVHTLGGVSLLPALRPEHMVLRTPAGAAADVTGSFVAVCETLGRGEYDAIVGTDMVSEVSERSRK